LAKAAPGGITHRGAALDMSAVASDRRADLLALASLEIEYYLDTDELALALTVLLGEAVRVLLFPAVGHLARAPQDVDQREDCDERRRECEQRQDGHAIADRPLGEPQADGLLDVVCGTDGDEPRDTGDDDALTDHHEGVAARLCVASTDDEVPFTVALTLADQYEPEQRRDGHQRKADGARAEVHGILQYEVPKLSINTDKLSVHSLGSYSYILP